MRITIFIILIILKFSFILIFLLDSRYYQSTLSFNQYLKKNINYLSTFEPYSERFEFSFNNTDYSIDLDKPELLDSQDSSFISYLEIKSIPTDIDYEFRGEKIKLNFFFKKWLALLSYSVDNMNLIKADCDLKNPFFADFIKSISFYSNVIDGKNFNINILKEFDDLTYLTYTYDFLDIIELDDGTNNKLPSKMKGKIYLYSNGNVLDMKVEHWDRKEISDYVSPYITKYFRSLNYSQK